MAKERLGKNEKNIIILQTEYDKLKKKYQEGKIPDSSFSMNTLEHLLRDSKIKYNKVVNGNKKNIALEHKKELERLSFIFYLDQLNYHIKKIKEALEKKPDDVIKKKLKSFISLKSSLYRSLLKLEKMGLMMIDRDKNGNYTSVKLTSKGIEKSKSLNVD